MKAPSRAKLDALDDLCTEAGALFHRLRNVAEQAHGRGSPSAGARSVMAELDEKGSRTTPQMARARSVSRQHIQSLVNRLLADALVVAEINPVHKKSSLITLTDRGRDVLHEMRRHEEQLLSQLPIRSSKKELRNAAATLREVRSLFEGQHWKDLTE